MTGTKAVPLFSPTVSFVFEKASDSVVRSPNMSCFSEKLPVSDL